MDGVMAMRINRLFGLALWFLLSSLLTACTNEVSVDAGLQWYTEHKPELMVVHEMLLEDPAIKRVTPGSKLEFAPKYEEFDAETEKVYREVEERAEDLGIKTIVVYRPKEAFAREVYSISYVIGTRGLSITSNSAVKIQYLVRGNLLNRYKSEAFRVLVPLDEKDWYVHYYEKD